MTKITVEATCPKNSMVAIIITEKRKTDRGMLYNGENRGMLYNGESRTFFIRAGAKVLIQEMPKNE